MYAVISAIMYAAVNGANAANGVNGANTANGVNTATGVNAANGVNTATGGWAWSWWWWVAIAVILIFIFAFAWRPSRPPRRMPEEALRERYTRGEITKQQYDDELRRLHSGA